MAKAKKKNKVHQQVPLINRIQAKQTIVDALVDEAVKKQSEERAQRVIWMCCIAMKRAFGIGSKRFYEKFAPEFDKVSKWWEHNAEADIAYADTKLSELARELAPDEPILIGRAYDVFDDRKGEVADADSGKAQ